jgi:hypothetical protein
MTAARVFRGFRFPAEVILWAVRWYLQFPLSYRDLERILADRGVAVDHTTMYRLPGDKWHPDEVFIGDVRFYQVPGAAAREGTKSFLKP